MKELELNLICWHRDGGDGSAGAQIFNDKKELAIYLENSKTTIELIESGDDPYKHGELSNVRVKLLYNEADGSVKIVGNYYFGTD